MKKEVVEKVETLMVAALGLIAALAWNAAIQSLFAQGGILHFLAAGGVWLYALVVTILAIILTIWISKISAKAK